MANNQNDTQAKENSQDARIVDAVRANIQTPVNQAGEQGKELADATRDGIHKMSDIREKAAESTKKVIQDGVNNVSQQARETANRFSKNLGFSGEDSEHLAAQSKQNMEMVTRCGTVLSQAFHETTRRLFDMGQKQFQRNLDGLTKLTHAKSVHEFASIQSELLREGMQHMVQDGKGITDTSAHAINEASKSFSAA